MHQRLIDGSRTKIRCVSCHLASLSCFYGSDVQMEKGEANVKAVWARDTGPFDLQVFRCNQAKLVRKDSAVGLAWYQ